MGASVRAFVENSIGEPLSVVLNGSDSAANSSMATLLADEVFTGSTWVDMLDYGMLTVGVSSDVDSATDGLEVQWSIDGITQRDSDLFSIIGGSPKTFTFGPALRYFRIKYTNGAADQTSFHLSSIARKTYVKPSSHRIEDLIVSQDDAELVKAVLSGQITGDGFINIGATTSGNLKTSDAENGLAIAKGDVVGTSFIHKFGAAPDFDSTDLNVDIWDGANDATLDAMVYTYSATADIDSIVSSSAADTMDIEVQGLDTNYNIVTQTITLTGQTRKALTTNLIRVFRLKNVGSVSVAGVVYCYVDSTISAGVPTDKTKVRALINDGNNQTLMAIYTIPEDKTAYMRDWFAGIYSKAKTVSVAVSVFVRPFGQVFQLKHLNGVQTEGTSSVHFKYSEPEIIESKSDIVIRASTDTNLTAVSAGFDLVLVDN